MKFLVILTLVLGSIGLNSVHATTCQQEDLKKNYGPYIEVMGGANFYNLKSSLKTDPGYYFGGIVGYKLSNNIRLELETSYQRSRLNAIKFPNGYKNRNRSGNAHSWSYMANCLFDLDLNFPLIPYFGAGIGYSQLNAHYSYRNKFNDSMLQRTIIHKNNDFTYQAIVGLKYVICKDWETSIDYRFCEIGSHHKQHKVGLTLARYF